MIKRTLKKIKKYILSVLAWLLLKSIKSYFCYPTITFISLLRKHNFHPAIINNPQILFRDYCSKKIFIPFWANVVLKVFVYSIKIDCWNTYWRCNLLRYVNLNNVYIYHSGLLIKDFYPPKYNEIQESAKLVRGKKVVYSVMFGDYDEIFDPIYISNECDYILFTDNENFHSNIWQINKVKINENYSYKWNVLYYKLLAHNTIVGEYEFSIYIDANIYICGDITKLINYINEDVPLVFFKHESMNNVFDEINRLIQLKWVPKIEVLNQYNIYLNEGFKDDMGHIESGVLIRKHNDKRVKELMEFWFNEFTKYPYRDQFSIMYSIWKTDMKNFLVLNGHLWDNQFMIHNKNKHKKDRILF